MEIKQAVKIAKKYYKAIEKNNKDECKKLNKLFIQSISEIVTEIEKNITKN